jgi:lipoyl-dependent peroxiredoxin
MDTMKRTATAHWAGGLKDGQGSLTAPSGVLSNTQYSFSTRFEDGIGTNPEELIAAAHAGCFTMALSAELGKAGFTPDSLDTVASLTMEKTDAGMTITTIHLAVTGKVPGASAEKFVEIATGAKKGCPVSRVLNANITLDATLAS